MAPVERVLDPGPICYQDIALFGDPDLEHGLRHAGLEPQATTYRLIEIPIAAIKEVATMDRWRRSRETAYVDALRTGQEFPPIVVMRREEQWWLLDGVNRTFANWVLGTVKVRAYELLD